MPANARQKRCYRHSVTVWRGISGGPDMVTKKRPDEVWTLIARGVPCLYTYTTNISDATDGVGRVKRPTFFTNDDIHFVADQDVREGDIIVNTSVDPRGRPVPGVYHECHRLLGQPQIFPDSGGRRANFRGFEMQTVEDPPPGVGP